MKNEITTAARRISRAHNARIRAGFAGDGKMVFGRDGSGGAWYSAGSYGFGDNVVVPVGWSRMTAEQAQRILDGGDW